MRDISLAEENIVIEVSIPWETITSQIATTTIIYLFHCNVISLLKSNTKSLESLMFVIASL